MIIRYYEGNVKIRKIYMFWAARDRSEYRQGAGRMQFESLAMMLLVELLACGMLVVPRENISED